MSSAGSDLTGGAIRGVFWNMLSRYSGKLLALASVVILARLLDKDAFGVAGYALLFVGMLEHFRSLGVAPAVIYYRDDPEAPSTAFWIGLTMGLVFLVGTWFAAPLAGDFFNDPRAVDVVRALAPSLPFTALGAVHRALLRKDLKFKRKFVPDFVRAVSKGGLSIVLASLAFGAWSLVLGQLGGVVGSVIAVWLVCGWRPTFTFARRLVRPLLTFGLAVQGGNLGGVLVRHLDHLIVGRFLGAGALGIYTLALRIPELVIMQLCSGLGQVLFPLYSKMRDDPELLRRGFIEIIRYITLVTVPMGVGLALIAEPLVLTVFGAKWREAIPVLQALAIFCMVRSFAYNSGDVYKAQGRAGLMIWVEALRLVVLLPALWWAATVPASVAAVAWTRTVLSVGLGGVELFIASRLLTTPFTRVLAAGAPALACGAGMGGVVLAVLAVSEPLPATLRIVLAVVAGVVSYLGLLWLLARDTVETAVRSLRDARKKKKRKSEP